MSVRDGDLLGRFGGDEFVALLVDLDLDQAADVVRRVATAVSSPSTPEQPRLLSVGWACDGPNLTTQLSRADVALYAAKTAGRGRAVAAHDRIDRTSITPAPQAGVPTARTPALR